MGIRRPPSVPGLLAHQLRMTMEMGGRGGVLNGKSEQVPNRVSAKGTL
jgi:hypothetical protein